MKPSPYHLASCAAAGLLLVLATPSFGQGQSQSMSSVEAQKQPIQISQVPKAARDAAQKALHATPTDAKVVVGTSPQEYELIAKDESGKEMSVHVLADGKVLKNEKGRREAKAPEETPRR